MATVSEVKNALDNIATVIADARNRLKLAKAEVAKQESRLAQLPTDQAGIISEIDGYTSNDAFEVLAKDELDKLTVEFGALRTAASQAQTWLNANVTEF